MVMPMAARIVFAVSGGLLVIWAWRSVIGTLIVSRSISTKLTIWVDLFVNGMYQLRLRKVSEYRHRDRILATQPAAVLMGQLVAWLGVAYVGFTFLLWPFSASGIGRAATDAGSSMFTLGFAEPSGSFPAAIVFLGAGTGLIIVALQIGYLPTLYAAFNRRETEVALLNGRAGVPSWGPELLARTHYALGSGMSTLDTMPDLYAQWERWAADVAESHTTYLPLVRFRSPGAYSSWVTALLAVIDSAALFLALNPDEAPEVAARLCLRGGFQCFVRIAQAMGIPVPMEPDPQASITLTYEEFLDGVAVMKKVGFPVKRDPEEAWPDFAGWRVNYEQAAYAVASAVHAVPALWSGPRVHNIEPIAPLRPPYGRPPADKPPADKPPAEPATPPASRPRIHKPAKPDKSLEGRRPRRRGRTGRRCRPRPHEPADSAEGAKSSERSALLVVLDRDRERVRRGPVRPVPVIAGVDIAEPRPHLGLVGFVLGLVGDRLRPLEPGPGQFGRLLGSRGPVLGPFGPDLGLELGHAQTRLGGHPRVPLLVRPRRRPAGRAGLTGRAGVVDRVPGHAVGFPGRGHPPPDVVLARLVLRHDRFFPAGRPASARHG